MSAQELELERYCECMEEIKRRTTAIDAILDGRCTTSFPATNVEFLCLQIRKILELIALASVVANRGEYAQLRAKFASDWHANRILDDLGKVNPNFYPKPVVQVVDEATGKVVEVKDRQDDYLTKEDFVEAYEQVSEVLHATNPYSAKPDYKHFSVLVQVWREKIVNLLNHHIIQLLDVDYQVWVLMQANNDGRVHAWIFGRIHE